MPPLVSDLSDISKPAMKGITVMRIQELADHSGPVLRRLGLPRLELCSTGQDREPVFLAYLEQPTKVPSRLRLACLRTARHGLSTAIHLPEVPVELHDCFPERRRLPGCYVTTRANTPTCYQARPTDPNVSPTNQVEDLLGAERFHKGTLSFDESDTRDS